jgi:predicted metal-dependent peptidase
MTNEILRGDALVARARRCAMSLGWRTPMFLPALQHCKIVADPATSTASIDTKGIMRFGEDFCSTLTDAELSAVVAHELCHMIYRHAERREDRKHKRFNIACDMALNQILREAQESLPSCALYPTQGQETWTAEAIYDKLPDQDESDGQGPAMAGCGPLPGDPDADGEPGAGNEPSQEDIRQWREIAAQCSMQNRGDKAGQALSRLFDMPAQKVRWDEIIRNALSAAVQAHGRDDQTWRKRGRRSGATGPQFAGYTAYKAQAAVVIDSSGSVPDESLSIAAYRVREIAQQTGVRVYMVVSDVAVHFSGWVTHATSMDNLRGYAGRGRGGTDFSQAYAEVAQVHAKFDALVHLTDGECTWPTPAVPLNCKKLVVALIGSRNRGYMPKDDPRIRAIDALLPKA